MGRPAGRDSRKLHQALRELTAHYLTGEGIEAVAKPAFSKISESIDLAGTPDVAGLDGVWIDVAIRGAYRLSTDLDQARLDATAAGYPVAALVAQRTGREISEAYVVTTLEDFSRLARAAAPIP